MAAPGQPEDWRAIGEARCGALLEVAARGPSLGDVERLRRDWPAGLVTVALEVARARAKAVHKMSEALAGRLVADAQGVEMASSEAAAAWKRSRMRGARYDLCCGIGMDSVGEDVIAVDFDPARVVMAGVNAGARAVHADVTAMAIEPGRGVHIDPSRRDEGGKRTRGIDELRPSIEFVRSLVDGARSTAVKLAPGTAPEVLPGGEWAYLSEAGRLTQGVHLSGAWARGDAVRTAVLIPDARRAGEGVVEMSGRPEAEGWPAVAGELGAWVYAGGGGGGGGMGGGGGGGEAGGWAAVGGGGGAWVYAVDVAAERARLWARLCAETGTMLAGSPGAGLLTSVTRAASPWLTAFRVVERMVWNRKRVKGVLAGLGAGIVEVKTRGRVIDADAEQGALRGKGERAMTVFVQRLFEGGMVEAVVCERG